MLGFDWARGAGSAERAAKEAITSPLLEASIHDARGIIVPVRMSPEYGYEDIDAATTMMHNAASEKAIILWGCMMDENMEDELQVTLIASGFETAAEPAADGAVDLRELPFDDGPDTGSVIRMPENR